MNQSYFLYAEDDADEVDILNEILKSVKERVRIVAVSNGFDLLSYLQEIKQNESFPSLIILDKKMPRLNGLETLKLLKSDDLYRLIPVIVFTSALSPDEKDICSSLGAETLLKPNEYSNWNGVVHQMCSYIDEE